MVTQDMIDTVNKWGERYNVVVKPVNFALVAISYISKRDIGWSAATEKGLLQLANIIKFAHQDIYRELPRLQKEGYNE